MANWYDIINLDRRFILTGVYASSVTTWTLPGTAVDTTLDTVVLGTLFGNNTGKIVSVVSDGGTPSTYITTSDVDYSAGTAVLGRNYTASSELTRPYIIDRQENPDIDAEMHIISLSANLHNTGEANIRWSYPRRADKTVTIDVDPVNERSILKAWCSGDAKDVRVFIEAYGPKPFTCTALEWVVQHMPRDN